MKGAPGAPPRRRRPEFGDDGATRPPFGAQPESREKPEDQKGPVVRGERSEPRKDGVPQDREHEHAAATDVVGKHTCYDSSHRPSQQSRREQAGHIYRHARQPLRRKELARRDRHHKDERIILVSVEHPAQPRGGKRSPGGTFDRRRLTACQRGCDCHQCPPCRAVTRLRLLSCRETSSRPGRYEPSTARNLRPRVSGPIQSIAITITNEETMQTAIAWGSFHPATWRAPTTKGVSAPSAAPAW